MARLIMKLYYHKQKSTTKIILDYKSKYLYHYEMRIISIKRHAAHRPPLWKTYKSPEEKLKNHIKACHDSLQRDPKCPACKELTDAINVTL